MDGNITISVIVPVFNVAKYLEKCVQSVISQNYPHIEIILVDDGSNDESPQICDYFAKEYPNVYVIHQLNSGLSNARNVGIEAASGDYIMFLDGDDFWDDSNAIFRIVERLRETYPDVLNYSYVKYFEDTGLKKPYFSKEEDMPADFSRRNSVEYLAEKGLYIASACNKVIRSTVLDTKMKFTPGIYSEDIEWCARLLIHVQSMDFICMNFYCYRQRRGSITHTIDSKKCSDLCNNILACLHLCEETTGSRKQALLHYTAYQYATFFAVQAQAEKIPEKNIQQLKKYSQILRYHTSNRKIWVLYICCRILGYTNTCHLIRSLRRR